MDILETCLEVVKYTIPALVVMATSYMIVKKFLVSQIQRKQIALFKDTQDITMRLRLHAYERIVLFLERISPRQLVARVFDPSMTAYELQVSITITIRTEFEHNLSQQIYVTRNAWETVKGVKEQEINMYNQIAKSMDPNATAKDYHARIMGFILKSEEDLPTDVALKIINDEVRKVMSFEGI